MSIGTATRVASGARRAPLPSAVVTLPGAPGRYDDVRGGDSSAAFEGRGLAPQRRRQLRRFSKCGPEHGRPPALRTSVWRPARSSWPAPRGEFFSAREILRPAPPRRRTRRPRCARCPSPCARAWPRQRPLRARREAEPSVPASPPPGRLLDLPQDLRFADARDRHAFPVTRPLGRIGARRAADLGQVKEATRRRRTRARWAPPSTP